MKKLVLKLLSIVVLVSIFQSCEETFIEDEPIDEIQLKSANTSKVRYIVVLSDNDLNADLIQMKGYENRKAAVQAASSKILERADVLDGEVELVYGTALQGFSILIPPGQLKKLQDDPSVKYIEQDKIVTLGKPVFNISADQLIPGQDAKPWGITRVNGGVNYTGSNVAWIIDSGIDFDHPDLNVDQSRGTNFTHAKSADDDNGHGSHVAGTIAAIYNNSGVVGVAAGATVIPIKVLDRRGSGWISWIIAGIDYVASNGSSGDVANMSLGGGASTSLDDAVKNAAANSGVRFVLAAGNEYGDANDHSPARANGTNIFTVSAMGEADIWAEFSNSGNPPIDYCAPGVDVLSCYYSGLYAIASGTSMAAPHIAGLLLLGDTITNGYVNNDPDGNADPILVYNGSGGTTSNSNSPPAADFEYSVNGLSVSFNDLSTDDGNIISWEWDFDDGNTSTDENPIHNYGLAGDYNVSLSVTDDSLATTTISKNITLTENTVSDIILSAIITGNNVKKATLTWTGTTSPTVDIYKIDNLTNDTTITTVTNSGSYNENLGKITTGSFTYYIIDEYSAESNHVFVSVN